VGWGGIFNQLWKPTVDLLILLVLVDFVRLAKPFEMSETLFSEILNAVNHICIVSLQLQT